MNGPDTFLRLFFLLFFGVCMGDVGYTGFWFYCSNIFKKTIVKPEMRSLVNLAQFLGGQLFCWG
jgi:vacuolar-type H+-ATPase subunit I/STV1